MFFYKTSSNLDHHIQTGSPQETNCRIRSKNVVINTKNPSEIKQFIKMAPMGLHTDAENRKNTSLYLQFGASTITVTFYVSKRAQRAQGQAGRRGPFSRPPPPEAALPSWRPRPARQSGGLHPSRPRGAAPSARSGCCRGRPDQSAEERAGNNQSHALLPPFAPPPEGARARTALLLPPPLFRREAGRARPRPPLPSRHWCAGRRARPLLPLSQWEAR